MTNLESLTGEVLDQKYLIDRLLGKGGMGAVYLATHLGTKRPVALKVISPQFMSQAEFVERFRREAEASGRLRHPNVVDVTDFGFAQHGPDRVAYLVMEYLDGCTLGEILAEESRLPLPWVVDILEQVCSAVHEAHSQGIIHRDLKPDNIWLEPNQRGGYTIKVLDFGLAKLGEARPLLIDSTSPVGMVERTYESWTQETPGISGSSGTAANTATSPSDSQARAERRTIKSAALEAQTLVQPSGEPTLKTPETASEEAVTQILQAPVSPVVIPLPPESSPEAVTQVLPASNNDRPASPAVGVKRTAQEAGDTPAERAARADTIPANDHTTAADITRMGSIMGTPIYMSPEQCRGQRLDERSDVYSIGVIAYQMLTDKPPFIGEIDAVIKLHCEEAPDRHNLKAAKVSRKVASVILSALAKDPDRRPPTATAFSGALRAHSEGTATLFRRTLVLFSEFLPLFLKVSLIAYIPAIILNIIQLPITVSIRNGFLPGPAGSIVGLSLGILLFIVTMFSASVSIGATSLVVTQLLAAPLRPIHLRSAFTALRRSWRPFLLTSMLYNFLAVLGMAMCLIPGLIFMFNYCLTPLVVIIEGENGRAALARAKVLFKRSRRTVIKVILFHLVVPISLALILSLLIVSVIEAFKIPGGAKMAPELYQILNIPILVVFGSFSAILTSLTYLKTRQAGGETLKEVLYQFETDAIPARKWQRRMRERLSLTITTSRKT